MNTESLNGKRILITGAAGFIGGRLVARLLGELRDATLVGLDDLNAYYDPALKERRLANAARLASNSTCDWRFVRGSVTDRGTLDALFAEYDFEIVVHLAAQAGVRYSIERPDAYVEANVVGFFNILEACRARLAQGAAFDRLTYASSSSVYGNSKAFPLSTTAKADEPVSLYAATKRSNELFARSYAALYGLKSVGLRFFTVYGPEGRPDMFYYSAAERLVAGQSVRLFNNGNCRRDFTYIDDALEGITRVMARGPIAETSEIYNLGAGRSTSIVKFIETLRDALVESGALPSDFDLQSHIVLTEAQPGDVEATLADVEPFERAYGRRPSTGIGDGLRRFADWFTEYKAQTGR